MLYLEFPETNMLFQTIFIALNNKFLNQNYQKIEHLDIHHCSAGQYDNFTLYVEYD